MYCRKCGNVLPDSSKFCGKCGCEVYIPNISVNYGNSYQNVNNIQVSSTEVSQTNSIALEEKGDIPSIELMPVEEINQVSKNGIVLTIVFGTFFLAMMSMFILAVLNSNVI